ncbi:MAG: SDR family NAD(P)-dependent oxidoreductase [Rhizobiales bacterium]|nr:SDR family NAD(P)-dependent oxidoreductase [Hyphomicrobiales bacterium]
MTAAPSSLPQFAAGNTAVVTGGASGIGLAAATRYAGFGMNVAIADRAGEKLDAALRALADIAGAGRVMAMAVDVSRAEDMQRLAAAVEQKFGAPSVVMNNAGIGDNPGEPWENGEGWRTLIDTNFWGVVNGTQAFAPMMLAAARPAFIVNTGSKQGITTPPGNLAYNVSKAAVKTFTEGLAHALRNSAAPAVSAHLLIPGFTYTGLTVGATEKPAGAWTGGEVVDFMLESLARGDFYILCPDNEVTRAMDEKRIAWAAGDIIENRPALSRWHPDHAERFAEYMKR